MLVLSLISACNWDQADPGQENYTNPTEQNLKTNKNGTHETPIVHKTSGDTERAKELVQLTEQVEGVEYARVIVSGMYTVVGAKIQKDMNKDEVVDIIYQKVNSHTHGANAVVTTDPKHLKKLQQWGKEINEGSLKSEIYNGLGRMISNIKPNENYPSEHSIPSEDELKQDRINETSEPNKK